MESLEVSAKTVEEAIELALDRLGANRSEVEIEVLSEGRAGILGFGAEEARVRVTLPHVTRVMADEVAKVAKEVLENILEKVKVKATVSLRKSEGGAVSPTDLVAFDIKSED